MAAPGRQGSQVTKVVTREAGHHAGASAVKESGHFEVRKSSSQVTGCTFFPHKVDLFSRRPQNRRQSRIIVSLSK